MRKMNGKRFILGLMALILCVTACAPAFASANSSQARTISAISDAVASSMWMPAETLTVQWSAPAKRFAMRLATSSSRCPYAAITLTVAWRTGPSSGCARATAPT